MKIRIHQNRSVMVVTVHGSILQENVTLLRNRLLGLIEEGRKHLVIDMQDSSYISSMGLAVIVEAKNKVLTRGGDLRLANISQLTRNLFTITNLLHRIEVFKTVDEAVASFHGEEMEEQGGDEG